MKEYFYHDYAYRGRLTHSKCCDIVLLFVLYINGNYVQLLYS
jgi:hypothetical protein